MPGTGTRTAPDGRQLTALQKLLRAPGSLVEARVDYLEAISTDSSQWRSFQQIRVPDYTAEQSTPALVSLGIFKKNRLPDLIATDHRGERVSIVRRQDRAAILAIIFAEAYLTEASETDRAKLGLIAARVIGGPPDVASAALQDYRSTVLACNSVTPSQRDSQLTQLEKFRNHTHVLAWVYPDSAGRVIVEATFSRSSEVPTFRDVKRVAWRDLRARKLGRACWLVVRWLLMLLGLLPAPIRFKLDGANHCHSYHFLVRPPSGLQVRRVYWRRLQHRDDAPEVPTYSSHESAWAVLSCYHPQHSAAGGASSIDVGVFGPGLRLVWALVVVTLGVLLVLRQRLIDGLEIEGLIGVASVIPSAALGVLSERSNELTKHMTRWVQRALMVLVALAVVATLGASVTFFDDLTGTWSFLSDIGMIEIALVYGAAVLVIVTYIAFLYPFLGTIVPRGIGVESALQDVQDVRAQRRTERVLAVATATAAIAVGWYCYQAVT